MKTIMRIVVLLGLIAAGATLVFGGIVLSQYLQLSIIANTALAAAALSAVMLCWWYWESRAKRKQGSLKARASSKVWAWRIVGASIIVFGAFLYLGNRIGTFQTFPFEVR